MTLFEEIKQASEQMNDEYWERKAKETTLTELLQTVCIVFDTTRSNVQSKSRKQDLCVYPRQAFCWVAYYKLDFKTKEIALFLGYNNHSMTCHGRDSWQDMLDLSNQYPNLYKEQKAHHNNLINAVYNRF